MTVNFSMNRMVRYAMRMMFGTFASRILGLVREMLIAAFFGATRQLDAFFVSYTLANLARQLLAEGALSASFVPVFARTLDANGIGAAKRLAREALSVVLAASAVVVCLGVVFSPLLVSVMAPGFSHEEKMLAVSLTRRLFPFLILVSVGALAMGILNSMDSFFVPAVAPALSNVAFIALVLAFYPAPSLDVLVAAVLLGGACSAALQLFWTYRCGILLVPARPTRDNADLRTMMKLFLPYAAGLSLNQLNPLIGRMLGSFLEGGGISALNYADRVLQLPLGLFVIAISQAVLPMLSKIPPDDRAHFRDFLRDALRFNLFAVLPVAIAMFLFSSELVHVLFYRGAFGQWAWEATSKSLAFYGLGLPGMACTTIIMRALYAKSMPSWAVKVTAFTVVANLTCGALLMGHFSYAGLALGTSLASSGAAFVGAWGMKRVLGMELGLFDMPWVKRQVISVGLFTACALAYRTLFAYPVEASLAVRSLWLAAAAALGGCVYCFVTLKLKCPEWLWVKKEKAATNDEL